MIMESDEDFGRIVSLEINPRKADTTLSVDNECIPVSTHPLQSSAITNDQLSHLTTFMSCVIYWTRIQNASLTNWAFVHTLNIILKSVKTSNPRD